MSFITNDTFPVHEIERFLIGKTFLRQSKSTKDKITGTIAKVDQSFKMVFIAEFQKAFFKPVIQVQSSNGVWYDIDEVWIESIMPYKNYGGPIVTMDAVKNPSPNGLKLPGKSEIII